MAAKPKLTEREWLEVKHMWEADPRPGYTWLVREMDLPVSAPAVRKTAVKEGWEKGAKPSVKPKAKALKAKRSLVSGGQREGRETIETFSETIETLGETIETLPKVAVGRPTKYRPEYDEQAKKLCMLGATDKQLADFFEVAESTINDWKHRSPSFWESVREGKMIADAEVAYALYQRAVGYDHEAIHFSNVNGEVIQTPYTKHYPPEPWAASWWLKNRQPHLWKDKVEVQEEINVNVFPPKEELDAIYEKALAEAEEIEMRIVQGRAERLGIDVDSVISGDFDYE